MIGPIVVFIVACGIVATYMTIVHSFLRASEQGDAEQTPPFQRPASNEAEVHEILREPHRQWAH